jgi:hypothetical protein
MVGDGDGDTDVESSDDQEDLPTQNLPKRQQKMTVEVRLRL